MGRKPALGLLLLILSYATLAAEEVDSLLPAELEVRELTELAADTSLSEITVADVTEVVNMMSVARQQRAYVERAGRLSWFVPGLGHYAIEAGWAGAGFFLAELTIRALTSGLAYLFLPAPVRIANLNYLQTPVGTIRDEWLALTPAELVAPVTLQLSGSVLSMIVRDAASRHARGMARDAVVNGEVVFEPDTMFGR